MRKSSITLMMVSMAAGYGCSTDRCPVFDYAAPPTRVKLVNAADGSRLCDVAKLELRGQGVKGTGPDGETICELGREPSAPEDAPCDELYGTGVPSVDSVLADGGFSEDCVLELYDWEQSVRSGYRATLLVSTSTMVFEPATITFAAAQDACGDPAPSPEVATVRLTPKPAED